MNLIFKAIGKICLYKGLTHLWFSVLRETLVSYAPGSLSHKHLLEQLCIGHKGGAPRKSFSCF
jgi:hypothetical protein